MRAKSVACHWGVPLRVGLNATCLTDRPSGARQRFIGIYGALARRRPDIEFIVYEPRACRIANELHSSGNIVARPTPIIAGGGIARLLSGLEYWPHQLHADGLNLFEAFHMPMVKAPACPTLLTIHDARHIHDKVPWPRRIVNRAIWRRALAQAAGVITVSDTMRREILAFAPGVDITTVYNGVEPAKFQQTSSMFSGRPYLLAVGHLEARKNYETLIDAMDLLRQRGTTLSLVIVGRDGGSLEDIRSRINARGLTELVSIEQEVGDDALAALYRRAALVVCCSLYEGFGVPLIEAMAADRPLIVSDIPVFRELTQDRGIYFNPRDSNALAEVILRIQNEPGLGAATVAFGRQRVRDFAFDTLAEQICALYDRFARA